MGLGQKTALWNTASRHFAADKVRGNGASMEVPSVIGKSSLLFLRTCYFYFMGYLSLVTIYSLLSLNLLGAINSNIYLS